jgi:hypothetical protein
MLLRDWLFALRPSKIQKRRIPRIPISAEVLEDRAAPSESLRAILGGGLLLGGGLV